MLERPRLLLFLLPPPSLLSHLQEPQWMGQVLLRRILRVLRMVMVVVTMLMMVVVMRRPMLRMAMLIMSRNAWLCFNSFQRCLPLERLGAALIQRGLVLH